MTGIKKLIGFFLLSIMMMGCNSQSANDPRWKEAAAIQQKALDMGQEVAPQLESLVQRRNSLSVQGRALSKEEQGFIDRVYALEEQYNQWKADVAEIPDNNSTTAAKMLQLQQDHFDRITEIRDSVAQLLE